MMKQLLAGCGGYLQGEDALAQVAPALGRDGRRQALVLAGRTAFAAVEARLWPTLAGLCPEGKPVLYRGHCTGEDVATHAAMALQRGDDCVVGVGGGKVLDLAKAVAHEAGLPVYAVPTSAATCAAYAPLSVIYHPDGTQREIRFFPREVAGVFADTRVLAEAPARLLAAGLADATAKACEYASLLPNVHSGALPIGKYLGVRLAEANDEEIAACALPALEAARRGEPSPALEDAVFCAIAATGVVSGLGGYGGRGGARFAVAHAVNEALRGLWFPPGRWLHGEVVAVGVLWQMAANGASPEAIARRRALFGAMGVPTVLAELSPLLTGEGLATFRADILNRIQATGAQRETVCAALAAVT